MAFIDFDSVEATADSYMTDAAPDTNYGNSKGMYVSRSRIAGTSNGIIMDSYVGFDLPATIRWSPAGCLLRLYVEECTLTEDQVIDAMLIADNTDEYTVTYNNYSYRSPTAGIESGVIKANSAPGTIVEIDVSPLLRASTGSFNLDILKLFLRQYEWTENASHQYTRFGTRESGHPATIIISEAVLVTEKVFCSKDAYVDSLSPTLNFINGKIFVTNVPERTEFIGPDGTTYPTIPAHRKISYIGISMNGYHAKRYGAVDLYVVFTLDIPNSFTLESQQFILVSTTGWTENTITWNNAPGPSGYGFETAYYVPESIELRIPYADWTLYLSDFWGNDIGAYLNAYLALNNVNSSPYYQMVFLGRHDTPDQAAHIEIIFPASPLIESLDRYVDGLSGSNNNDGQTPATPWRTIDYAAKHTPAYSNLHIKYNFYQEPIDGIICPVSMPLRWVNWDTLHSRIMPSIKSPPPIILNVIEDTFISSLSAYGNPDTVYGNGNSLDLADGNGWVEKSLLKFDISNIERATEKYYTLYMQTAYAYNPLENPMELYLVLKSNNWSEETLTYNNNATYELDPTNGWKIWEIPIETGIHSVDVSPIFRTAAALSLTECTIEISFHNGYAGSGAEGISIQFYSKEIAWMGVTTPYVSVNAYPPQT